MNRTLHDAQNAKKILQITADTMILVAQDGTCVDIDTEAINQKCFFPIVSLPVETIDYCVYQCLRKSQLIQ